MERSIVEGMVFCTTLYFYRLKCKNKNLYLLLSLLDVMTDI